MNVPLRIQRPLHWVGSARRGLLDFPEDVVGAFGDAFGVVQVGGQPPTTKPWKGEGSGVFELAMDFRGSRKNRHQACTLSKPTSTSFIND